MSDFRTEINAVPNKWSERIRALWDSRVAPKIEGTVVQANWFTARPYVDSYNAGSTEEGFTYVIREGNKVWQTTWRVGKPIDVYVEPITEPGEDSE